MRRLLFLISSSPSVFSIVYLNRVNRDFAIFRELGFSEFQAEFHASLVELTVQITHQRIDQSVARALSHILPTPIDAPRLNAHGIRSFDCSVDNMRIIRIHHEPCFLRERDGLSTDRICFQVSNSSECVRAPSRTLMHLPSQLHTLSLMRHVQSPKNAQSFISAPIQGYVYVLKCSGPLFYLIAATSSSNSFQAS